jgi:hypothetical protein
VEDKEDSTTQSQAEILLAGASRLYIWCGRMKLMSNPSTKTFLVKHPCCGGLNLVGGNFLPYGSSFTAYTSKWFSFGETIHAVKCEDCGNVRLFSGKSAELPR